MLGATDELALAIHNLFFCSPPEANFSFLFNPKCVQQVNAMWQVFNRTMQTWQVANPIGCDPLTPTMKLT
jgi:hypothetical protein